MILFINEKLLKNTGHQRWKITTDTQQVLVLNRQNPLLSLSCLYFTENDNNYGKSKNKNKINLSYKKKDIKDIINL